MAGSNRRPAPTPARSRPPDPRQGRPRRRATPGEQELARACPGGGPEAGLARRRVRRGSALPPGRHLGDPGSCGAEGAGDVRPREAGPGGAGRGATASGRARSARLCGDGQRAARPSPNAPPVQQVADRTVGPVRELGDLPQRPARGVLGEHERLQVGQQGWVRAARRRPCEPRQRTEPGTGRVRHPRMWRDAGMPARPGRATTIRRRGVAQALPRLHEGTACVPAFGGFIRAGPAGHTRPDPVIGPFGP